MPATPFPQVMTPGQMQMNLANGQPAHTPGATPWGNGAGMAGGGMSPIAARNQGPVGLNGMRALDMWYGGNQMYTQDGGSPNAMRQYFFQNQDGNGYRIDPMATMGGSYSSAPPPASRPTGPQSIGMDGMPILNNAPTPGPRADLVTRFDPRGRGANYNPYSTDASAMGQPGGATNWNMPTAGGAPVQQRNQNQAGSFRQQPNGYAPGGLAPPMQTTANQPQIRTPQLGYTPGAIAQQPAAPQSGLMAPRTPQPKMPGGYQKRY